MSPSSEGAPWGQERLHNIDESRRPLDVGFMITVGVYRGVHDTCFSSRITDGGLRVVFRARLQCERELFGLEKKHKLNIALDAEGPTFPFINQGEGERLELLRLLARSDIGLISMPIVPGS